LQRSVGNRALANALAIQRKHWWVLDKQGRDHLEMEAMKKLKGIELTDSGNLDAIVGKVTDGDTVTIHAHGNGATIHWAGEKLDAGAFAARLIKALLSRRDPQVKFALDVFACWSAGDLDWWTNEKGNWSPKESFVYRVADALKQARLTNVTVKGYVGKTKVYAGLEGRPAQETEHTLQPAGNRRSRRHSGPAASDPSLAYSMIVESGNLKVIVGNQLKETPAAKRL